MKKNYNKFSAHTWISFCRKALLLFVMMTPAGMIHAQQSYTFTAAGATGRFGPTQNQVNTAYNNTNLQGLVTVNAGIQSIVLQPGVYRMEAWGAQGGSTQSGSYPGGLGARMRGDFTLTATSTVNILVGQHGENLSTGNSGGGGGSFVWVTGAGQPLIAAGGGGGAGYSVNGVNAATTTAGTAGTGLQGTAGTNGNGANPGGGGWLSDGTNFQASYTLCTLKCAGNTAGLVVGGASPTTTILYHGCSGTSDTGDGGFGGGSGASGECSSNNGAGGGGGYSGGVGQSGHGEAGGGGGSFNGGSNQSNSAGVNSGNGKVIITDICPLLVSGVASNSVQPAICAGSSITLTTNGVSNYTWSSGATSSSVVVSPNVTTIYSVSATTSLNCSAVRFITVTVNSGPPVLTITSSSTSICLGNTVNLTASGAITYTWSNGISSGVTFTPSMTQTYSVAGSNGCGTSSAVTTITVAPLPVNVSASSTLVCQGYPTTLTAQAAATGFTWQPSAPNLSTTVVSPTSNIVYTVTVSDGTCQGISTIGIQTKTTPTITATTSSSTFCEGGSAVLNATGGDTYLWTPGNHTGSSVTVTPNSSVVYQVAGTTNNGCTAFANVVIVVKAKPTITAVTNKQMVCENGAAILTASGANSYTWTGGPSNSSTYSVNPSTTTLYTVTGTAQNGCTDERTVNVIVYIPVLSVSASAPGVCPGGQISISASTHGGSSYKWNGVSVNPMQLSPATTTVYVATANSNSNSVVCPVTNSITITVFPNPTITMVATKTVMCRNEKPAVITADGAATYVWQNNPATTNTISASVTTSNSYFVTGTDANGCTGTASMNITVNPCTAIAELNSKAGVRIYPNPSKGEFTVSSDEDIRLSVINELGQVVKTLQCSGSNDRKLSVNDLPEGIYFVVGDHAHENINQKVIISR